MSLDIKKYEVLLSTLDKGCFAKACEDLGYTQPAITHMMKSMEREIGFPLLKRSNKGIQLTSEGREVLPLIRELVAVACVLDWLVRYGADQMGLDWKLDFLIASIVVIWLVINELISILENVAALGAPVPGFLQSLIKRLEVSVEDKIPAGNEEE